MCKKKLIARISELEEEKRRAKNNEDCWKDMIMRFVEGLHENGVEAEIVFPEPEMIKCSSLEDGWEDMPGAARYIPGRTTEPPTLRFDFTEHDAKIKIENGEKSK